MSVEIRSLLRGEGDTKSFGRHLGTLLRAGDWVCLTGELGAGKTTLISGVLESIHPGARVRSPTYVLVEIYGSKPTVIHADLHRLERSTDVAGLALDDLSARDAIVFVEWADRAGPELPDDRLDLSLRYADGGREIRIAPRGERWETVARQGLLDRDRWQDALHPRD
ncbi:MAG: tRNA (adenosine(37)-N6)-threonylcarbamoyltransferase complex ATPase subunit type 1 TsaE [Candidatus Eiseniibacteriota bacterium]